MNDRKPVRETVFDRQSLFFLLHGLLGRSPRDFQIRAAVIGKLLASGRSAFDPEELEDLLVPIPESARRSALGALRRNGWLVRSTRGLEIPEAGCRLHEVLAAFRRATEGRTLPVPEEPIPEVSARDRLAAGLREALLPVLPPRPLVVPETLAGAARRLLAAAREGAEA
jgi:hypothetical protein